METPKSAVEIYQFHVWIRQISPMIWRRLLVRSDCSIADLHYTLQIAFGWSDDHLNLFHIHGQDYGVYHDGGFSFSKNPNLVKLSDFKFRKNERFTYEYDFGDCWEHTVRLEARLPLDKDKTYPRCIDGQRRAPPPRTVAVPSHSWRVAMRSPCWNSSYWRILRTHCAAMTWRPSGRESKTLANSRNGWN